MKQNMTLNVSVYSEIEPLKTVLLHRPGRELESLTPQYLDAMLFEDIPFLQKMREEHDQFALTLQNEGCEVLYVDDLLLQTIQRSSEAKDRLIRQVAEHSEIRDQRIREDVEQYLQDMDDRELASRLISGVLKSEVSLSHNRPDLSYFIRDDYPYYISPLPNLYFTRDPGTAVGDGYSINHMRTQARARETMLLSEIFHTLDTSVTDASSCIGLLEGYSDDSSIEGGDMLILDRKVAAVGCSARTEPWAIERFADRIIRPGGFEHVLVVQIPFTRAYMHLDTVFTMVDHDKFTIYPGVEPRLKVFRISRKPSGDLHVEQGESLRKELKSLLHIPAVDLIQTGGGDVITAAREQWNDSTNTLAVAPGKVVTYRRNMVSNDTLVDHGIEVLPIAGSELVRGRGGPRCMSMPLSRRS